MRLTVLNEHAGGPPTITGEEILRNVWQMEMGHSKWIDIAILFGMVVLDRIMFMWIIKTIEKVKPIIRALVVTRTNQSTHIEDSYSTPLQEAGM
ncbi:LOW QUALITY PROTEIN: hypothetical protein RJ640_007501 [Escallonia rubra]|uniref:Uncharacterized protein n=1 Tax=Escallonia rubra TaxID=112253 RepID=A0AA88QVB2_9ASTE|nr:LOW QUALITY PROTEIN: hypothetical protein RJ640_007501 [Escallonia rubra]